jgi:hypothetical protein
MRKSEEAVAWVVYTVALPHKPEGMNVVCEQAEWDAMERDQPGRHKLVRSDIPSEVEAELLARGTSGDAKVTLSRRRS